MADPHKVDINFLKLWFRLPTTIRKVDSECTGSTPLTRNRFKQNFFLNLEIPLPPLDEQRWIVAKIDELVGKFRKPSGSVSKPAGSRDASTASELHRRFVNRVDVWPKAMIGDAGEIIDPNPSHRMPRYAKRYSLHLLWILRARRTFEEEQQSTLPRKLMQNNRRDVISQPGDILYSPHWDNWRSKSFSGCPEVWLAYASHMFRSR